MSSENQIDEIKEELSESGERIGVEASDDEETMEPFDPQEISIQQKVVSMDVIIRRLRQGSIKLSPSFQRNEVWDETRKSRLIESLMLNIPLPMFYVAADEDGNWEVVDGLQRLSTIRGFLIGDKQGRKLKLKDLEFLGDKYNQLTFDEIESKQSEQKLINDIYETELRFTVINPGTPEAVKRNIFKRINTGGMPLTSQEIRHALYEGKSTELLQELVSSSSFRSATVKPINDSRMGARELILRLVSFMVLDRKAYKSNMDSWLSNTMRVINCLPDPTPEQLHKIFQHSEMPRIRIKSTKEISEKFNIAMVRGKKLFGEHAFRKSFDGERKSPINKSLFEVWGNVLSELTDAQYAQLIDQKEKLFDEYSNILVSLDSTNSISRHSSTQRGINDSYEKIHGLISSYIRKDS